MRTESARTTVSKPDTREVYNVTLGDTQAYVLELLWYMKMKKGLVLSDGGVLHWKTRPQLQRNAKIDWSAVQLGSGVVYSGRVGALKCCEVVCSRCSRVWLRSCGRGPAGRDALVRTHG